MTPIDFAPVLDIGISLLAAVLLAAGTWGVARFNQWLGLKNDAEFRSYLNGALYAAVDYGKARAKELNVKVDVENAIVAEAVRYAAESVPDALDRFGITDERLADMVKARLEAVTWPEGQQP